MASVTLVDEPDASEAVRAVFADIRETLGIEFVPNMYRALAAKPALLEQKWAQIKSVMQGPGKLDPLTREIVAVAVSTVSGCDY